MQPIHMTRTASQCQTAPSSTETSTSCCSL